MKLKDLIRGKRADNNIATATHATGATNEGEEDGTVANVATVSVANPWKDETVEDTRQQSVEEMLRNNPTRKYAVLVDDAESDPVAVTVGIRGLATFELHIPLVRYDGIALLQVLDEYASEADLNSICEASPLPIVNKCNPEAHSKPQRRAA